MKTGFREEKFGCNDGVISETYEYFEWVEQSYLSEGIQKIENVILDASN